MAIDVTITQRMFGKQPMPLDVILGNELRYGRLEQDHLVMDEQGENEIIVYDPACIGRGFSVKWHPNERKRLELRLPLPAPEEEIRQFYTAVARMMRFWKGKLYHDGELTTLAAFMQGQEKMIQFSGEMACRFAQEVIDGKHEKLVLWSAMWPMFLGREEAQRILKSPAALGEWLHERQSMDVYHARVNLYQTENGPMGLYVCLAECPAVYPVKPAVPFGVMDTNTGKPLVCNDWRVAFVLRLEEGSVGKLPYQEFVKRLGTERVSRYDAGNFLIPPLCAEEIKTLLENES